MASKDNFDLYNCTNYGMTYASQERLRGRSFYPVHVTGILWETGYNPTPQRTHAEITNWIRLNASEDEIILHEMLDYYLDNSQMKENRFYFANEELAKRFEAAVPELLSRKGWFFPLISELKLTKLESVSLACVTNYGFGSGYAGIARDMWYWWQDNCVGRIWCVGGTSTIIFEKAEDFVPFKLKFLNE